MLCSNVYIQDWRRSAQDLYYRLSQRADKDGAKGLQCAGASQEKLRLWRVMWTKLCGRQHGLQFNEANLVKLGSNATRSPTLPPSRLEGLWQSSRLRLWLVAKATGERTAPELYIFLVGPLVEHNVVCGRVIFLSHLYLVRYKSRRSAISGPFLPCHSRHNFR